MGKFIKQKSLSAFNKMMLISIIDALILGIIGLVMYFMPEQSNRIIGIITGVLFLLNGINILYKFIKREGAKLYSYNLIFGLLMIVLGLIIISVPFTVSAFITVCMGLYLIILGSNKITYGVWLKIGNDSSWLITLFIGLLLILFGILVITNPFSALTITKVVGIFFTISSILDITSSIMLKRRADKIIKIFW